MKFFISLLFIIITPKVQAYPEMVRHHYVNCLACHESPAGGGLLTPYGRSLSSEILSTWGTTKEARAFYGAFDNRFLREWFNIGGDFRGLQLHTENSSIKKGMFIRMQTGLETSIKYSNLKFVSFFGKQEAGNMLRGEFTRFYLNYQVFDELSIRVGRFTPNFGLNIAEHTWATRQGLGFGEGSERNQVEMMWSGEKWNSSLTISKQDKTGAITKIEKAVSTQLNYNFFDSYRVGADLWVGKLEGQSRHILGLHSLLGFSEKIYSLIEMDYQKSFSSKKGFFHFSKTGYEFIKGVHALLVEDYKKSDLNEAKTVSNMYGVGVEWYPRPHFEFEGIVSKKRVLKESREYADYAYLMMHYYF